MIQLLMKFLSPDKRALVELAMRMTASLDTQEERKAVAEYGVKMLKDGKVQVHEWSTFGSKLGIFKLKEKNNDR